MQIEGDTKSTLTPTPQERAKSLLAEMSLREKLGQMHQVNGGDGTIPDYLSAAIRAGEVGSVINETDPEVVARLQHYAVNETRLGIPLLIGRDVIHGFHSVFPIPLGMAASWCEQTIFDCARVSAQEAVTTGINWTFSPMIDIGRDPRWGRIAECFGEDPFLCSRLGVAMVNGYQTDNLSDPTAIAACAKHFAGYGASESGRDYNTTNLSEHEMREVHLPSFKAASDAGVASMMTSFSDINGVPASANDWLLNDVLRQEWHFSGMVVSDWESIGQLCDHGIAVDYHDAANQAFNAGVDMEMVSGSYLRHGEELLDAEHIDLARLDTAVERILILKFSLGLFDRDLTKAEPAATMLDSQLNATEEAALKSCVLLQNKNDVLPLNPDKIRRIALLGPLANDEYEQLGTWIFDGRLDHTCTVLQGLHELTGDDVTIDYHPVLENSRSENTEQFASALNLAVSSDVVVLCLGEESILSGEAHCRAELDLPGCQPELVKQISKMGKPVVLVVLAGRPLTLEDLLPHVDAVLYAWHPGTKGGRAIARLLLGDEAPSGKLPVSFLRKVGQIPLYYAQKPTGRPVTPDTYVEMSAFPERAPQTSLGMASAHIDTYFTPLFPFGFGLTYGEVAYGDLCLDKQVISENESVTISCSVTNHGAYHIEDIVQLYVRDLLGSVTRPVKELKGFKRIPLAPNETKKVSFQLSASDLSFWRRDGKFAPEPGHFQVWLGGSSEAELTSNFELQGSF